MIHVTDFDDYKHYLRSKLQTLPKRGRGAKSAWAQALGCQTSFITHVTTGTAHFSLEQAEKLNPLLGHTPEEGHAFLLLVQATRAGTAALRKYFTDQLETLRRQRKVVRERIAVQATITPDVQSMYYSAWYYAGIHMAVGLKKFKSKEDLARFFDLSLEKVSQVTDFLSQAGLIRPKGYFFELTERRIHVGTDSPLLSKHHTNWRLQSIRALEKDKKESLHYSSVIGISNADVEKMKALLLGTLEKSSELVRVSKEEDLHVLNLDFFRL